jgi:hypothetical protein
MRWITRERVKVDRVACPWLIKKFIDPDAAFSFVPREDVEHVPMPTLTPSLQDQLCTSYYHQRPLGVAA